MFRTLKKWLIENPSSYSEDNKKVKVRVEHEKTFHVLRDTIHYMDGEEEPVKYHATHLPSESLESNPYYDMYTYHNPVLTYETSGGVRTYYRVKSINVSYAPHHGRMVGLSKERVKNVVLNNVREFETEHLEKVSFTDTYTKMVLERRANENDAYEIVNTDS